jgi:predicted metal-binding membrane protein
MVAGRRIEAVIRRDRALVLSVLVVITGLAWFYLFHLANGMNAPSSMPSTMTMTASWSVTESALMFVMWVVMMVGMMLPSAAPMVLLYGLVIRKQTGRGVVFAPTSVFVTGYLIAWTGRAVQRS